MIQGVSKKMSRSVCLISLAKSSLESWDIFQMKGDIHRYVLSTISFLCDIKEQKFTQNNIGYQTIKIVKQAGAGAVPSSVQFKLTKHYAHCS